METSSSYPRKSRSKSILLAVRLYVTLVPVRLIFNLGLQTNLTKYKVPKEDIPGIAERSVGSKEGVVYERVVKIVESLY